jgi:hypothetical protein
LPTDLNQRAKAIVDFATSDETSEPAKDEGAPRAAVEVGVSEPTR